MFNTSLWTRAASMAAALLTWGPPAHAGNDWVDAEAWVGRHPSERVVPGKPALLAQPALRARLLHVLPVQEQVRLSQLSQEEPVQARDGLLVVHQCRPAQCPADLAMVVIDPVKQALWVGLFTRRGGGAATRWYASGVDQAALPESLRQEFRARHGN